MDAVWDRPSLGDARPKYVRIQGPFREGKTQIIFLGGLEPVLTHWKGATIPCVGSECKHCPDRLRRLAYAPAVLCYAPDGKKVNESVIFAIPEGCVAQLELIEEDEPLRGKVAVFSRKAGNQTPKIEFPQIQIQGELREAFDVQACLRRIWGFDHKRQEQQQPVEENREILQFRKMA